MKPKPDMLKLMQRALRESGDCYTLADIRDAIKDGRMQAFTNEDDTAFVVTEIAVTPRKKFLNVIFLCGELDAVMALQPQVAEFARANGCGFLLSCGREGWAKVLPQHGWERTGVIHVLDLGGYRG
ncbi:hypothetical protein [Enterovirga aerilata]|uniref:Uncharacterized protein n=1 Tax=Enterovirga aerilata TaxID=2730920 RepID=A0A849ILB2_9HYPH|nr:hypothetical protein [Enterovirga sp. DB1703]NNM74743.1 hypothetical protein [Enterovirga sp. DB1703]